MASSSLLLLSLLLLLLPLLLEILRILFFLAGVFLTGDSSSLFSTDLSFSSFPWMDSSFLSLRLGVLVSCGSRASGDAADVGLAMDSLPSSSPSLLLGSAEAGHAAASPTGPPPVSPPGIAWTMMSRILLTPPSLG
jgi:hypothetical protein